LQSAKGSRKWLQLHVDTPAEAAAAVACDIVILSCEPDHNLEAIRRVAPHAFLSVGMPHGAVASPEEAVRLGFAMMKRGADAVYSSHSPRFIEAMAAEGIPVTGHIGLVPNRATWTNFRAIGRTAEEAFRVLRAAKDLENAGAACIEVEVVPVRLADHITRATPLITMGMGCGSACDTQYLFSCDVLGTHAGHYPRHAKRYRDFAAELDRLQNERIAAFREYADDIQSGAYPEPRHIVEAAPEEMRQFEAYLASEGHRATG
ncbi:3-methyl-2-oxobutanoate hydroxymethyltransferase, partial [Mesorhizobium sp. M00.F.Ca.ET.149.01.1.1]